MIIDQSIDRTNKKNKTKQINILNGRCMGAERQNSYWKQQNDKMKMKMKIKNPNFHH